MSFLPRQCKFHADHRRASSKSERKDGALSRVLVCVGIVKPEGLTSVVHFHDDAAEKVRAKRALIWPPNLLRKVWLIRSWKIRERYIHAGKIQYRVPKVAEPEISCAGRTDRRCGGSGIEY